MARESLLVFNVSGIGDFVDSVPALRALRKERPGAFIVLAAAEKVAPLAVGCPFVDEVIALPTARGRGFPALGDLPRWLSKLRPLRGRFSTVACLYAVSSPLGGLWLRALLWWLAPETTIGPRSHGLGNFFSEIVDDPAPGEDAVEGYLKVASRVPAPDRTLALWASDEALKETKAWTSGLANWGKLDGPLILVALGGDRATRHESPERAARWLGLLQAKFGIRPILWGTKTDPGLPSNCGVIFEDARGRFGVAQSAALFRWADAVITTHSAPQHLASAWGVPTVVLVGPGDAGLYRPHLPAESMRMLSRSVPCAPCYFENCPLTGVDHQKCMSQISPEAFVEAFESILPAVRKRTAAPKF